MQSARPDSVAASANPNARGEPTRALPKRAEQGTQGHLAKGKAPKKKKKRSAKLREAKRTRQDRLHQNRNLDGLEQSRLLNSDPSSAGDDVPSDTENLEKSIQDLQLICDIAKFIKESRSERTVMSDRLAQLQQALDLMVAKLSKENQTLQKEVEDLKAKARDDNGALRTLQKWQEEQDKLHAWRFDELSKLEQRVADKAKNNRAARHSR